MSWRTIQITKALQGYDSLLYAKEVGSRVDIFRKSFEYVAYDLDGTTLLAPKEVPHRIFSLTDNWKAFGRPVEWGIEPILAKIRAGDLWKRDIASEQIASKENEEKSQERAFRNETEAFLKDQRRAIAKHWGDINTSTMVRHDRRRRDDRKIKLKG